MKSPPPLTNEAALPNADKFSIVPGGPLFQLLRRAHLTDDGLLLVRRRILVISLMTWLPLLVLSALEGHVFRETAAVSFLRDFEVHIRFLVAVPLLIGAELMVHRRLRILVRQFMERQIIPKNDVTKFDSAITAAFRLRDSVLAEVLLIAAVYTIGVMIIWRHYTALNTGTWYATPTAEGPALSFAGMWYGYVSLPIFQFLLCRWYFRMAIWAQFLWRVSRIQLILVPTHPDHNAGLGFVATTVNAFSLLVIAHSALLAGILLNRILHLGASLVDFKGDIAILVLLLFCVVLGPLLVFTPQLARAKRTGNLEYGVLAEKYVRGFDAKWLRGGAPAGESLLGSGDVQSLADLGNSLEVVRTMRIAPVTNDAILRLLGMILAPIIPLAFTLMSWDQLAKTLIGIVF